MLFELNKFNRIIVCIFLMEKLKRKRTSSMIFFFLRCVERRQSGVVRSKKNTGEI